MTVRGMITIIATLVVLFIISWLLTLILMAGVFIMFVFIMFYRSKATELAKVVQDKKAACSQIVEEAITNVRTVKAFSTEI